ncbi:alcohol dehydrogenase catalytic domain-containing protein [Brevibacillus humidisoli]|uniref:zinc-dependent alcohol dehydrogenase n=1 Tax=Brevibacillus humidisoli TaxID=2895522 RepID=UPI001E45AB48|nr:alcohol dehydrogenase catalytic domain-containing protein [Brevibacillus humidisoli]UFJ39917.1 alcohol dehydrogenase catalytic domain-containing protein [Brevibacillus humidisoli]
MKALAKIRPGFGNVQIIDLPEPSCEDGQVKVEVKFSGICGTDLHIYHDTFKSYPPVIMGHEFSGIVAEVGRGVRHVREGDRVTVLPSTAVTCGECDYCRQGFYMFCPSRRGMGHGVHGSFTKYAVVREDMVRKIPDFLTLEEAALSEPLACAVQPIEELTSLHVGDQVLLSGPGPIGLLCLSLLIARGCKVIVAGTTADKGRLRLAEQMGADVVVDVLTENLDDVLKRETNGRGVDAAVECAGAGASIASCLKALKPRGKYMQVGIVGREITIDFDLVLYKQIELCGSLAHSMSSWEKVMSIWEQRKLNLKPLITHTLPLSSWEKAFEICEQKQGGKVLLYYDYD